MATATPSRDGRFRLDLRIEVRVDSEDLAGGLAHAVLHDLAGFDSTDWSPETRLPGKARILKAVRAVMRGYGVEAVGYWRDDAEMLADAYEPEELEEWALAAVARAFPELRKGL